MIQSANNTKPKTVEGKVVARSISMRTLERAKAELEVRAYRKGGGRHRPWIWESIKLKEEDE